MAAVCFAAAAVGFGAALHCAISVAEAMIVKNVAFIIEFVRLGLLCNFLFLKLKPK